MGFDHRDVQMCVLCSMTKERKWFEEVRGLVTPEMFAGVSDAAIFNRLVWIWDNEIEPTVSIVTGFGTSDEAMFGDGGNLANGINTDYVRQVFGHIPSGSNAAYYCGILRDIHAFRVCQEVSKAIPEQSSDFEAIVAKIRAATSYQKGKPPLLSSFGDYIEPPTVTGVPTSFSLINENTNTGGWPKGQTSMVEAYTKGGKSVFMWQEAIALAELGYDIVYATFADLSKIDLGKRAIQMRCGMSRRPEEPGYWLDQWNDAHEWLRSLKSHLFVYDATEANTSSTIEAFIARMDAAKRRPDGFFLDYAQELTTQEKYRTEYEASSIISRKCRQFAKNSDAACVIGSQITIGGDGKPDIAKGSRQWDERAGLVLKLKILEEEQRLKQEHPYNEVEGLTLATIPYNRFGKSNVKAWLKFEGKRVRFCEL